MDDKNNQQSLKKEAAADKGDDDECTKLLEGKRQHTQSKEQQDHDDSLIKEDTTSLIMKRASTKTTISKPMLQGEASKNVEGAGKTKRAYKTDLVYLIGLTLTLGLSSMQFSLALGGTGQCVSFLRYQLNWGSDPEALDFYSTILATSGIVGISIGSLYGGDFTKLSRRKTVIYFNALTLLGSVLSLILNFKIMCLGRFFFGFSAGVLLCASPKIMDETIPPALIDKGFGASTNILMCLFGFAQMLLSLGMPTGQQQLATSKYWMVIYALQAPFCILAMYLHTFVYVEEPIDFCVKLERREEALRLIAKVYRWESPETHRLIYEEKCRQIQVGTQAQQPQMDNEQGRDENRQEQSSGKEESVWHALTSPEQRGSSWMSIIVALFNNMSGIGIINIYTIAIFEAIHKKGAVSRFTPIEDGYYMGFSGFLGAFLSYYTVSLLSRRAIFIGGHFIMAILLFATAYFAHVKQAELVLVSLCSFVVVFQATQGTVIFIYISEIVCSEAAMGLALFTLMICLTLQSMFGPLIISSKLGIDGMFLVLGIIHVAAFLLFFFFMKETQGLSSIEKKKLYAKKVSS